MAPFKLFRIAGSTSRSTSQETEPDPSNNVAPTNLVVTSSLNKLTTAITSSAHNNYINIDESDQTSENSSIMSLNNDQRALLSAGSTADQIGYSSPQQLITDIPPISPPPSYDSVMKENQLLALDKENNTIQTTIHTNLLVESFYTTPKGSNNNLFSEMNEYNNSNSTSNSENANSIQQSIASPVRENLLIDSSQCTGQNYCNQLCSNDAGGNNNDTYGEYEYNERRCLQNDRAERCSLDDENSRENYNNCSEEYSSECQNQYLHHQDNEYSNEYTNQYYNDGGHQQIAMNYSETSTKRPPDLVYKSTKELYKAVARECGITCKMADNCRCVDCQSRYFDCEFDQNENDTRQDHSDGGLGAGTPMFVNEVLHGTACTIL
ncbi:hypothetical protein PVAND_005645 [Polypedilum vanderplanki]|uniref:DUF4802 domain-containing protein n=1 Tax=Polypedilum vanderplanki TaxID=319348 RepID=A0A9J6C0N3_POLVA|nr:hypothetical protein PVAND_005645 [Polypedilum vanderplanki]